MRYLILFFIIIPVVEIYLLIAVGREIGALFTISLVLLTAAVGLSLLRQQGLETFFRARNKIDTGELPAKEMIEALIILFSGALENLFRPQIESFFVKRLNKEKVL